VARSSTTGGSGPAPGSGAPAACSGLVRIYPTATGETHALRGVDAHFHRHTVTALTGPSGSGKSTLLALLALRDRPSGGEVTILGRRASSLVGRERRAHSRRTLAWVPQRPTDGVFPHLTAVENVEQAARWRGAPGGEAPALLDRLGLGPVASVAAARLSGGEQQRVALACACVGSPPVVLCDEPTAELDEDTAELVLRELRRVAGNGSAVVVATHDPGAVAASHRVVALRHGVVSTEQWGADAAQATIDPAGRVQLPPDALELFPSRRAVLRVEGERVVLEPAGEDP
jgi:putative ABC transport system ATP-binding protein